MGTVKKGNKDLELLVLDILNRYGYVRRSEVEEIPEDLDTFMKNEKNHEKVLASIKRAKASGQSAHSHNAIWAKMGL